MKNTNKCFKRILSFSAGYKNVIIGGLAMLFLLSEPAVTNGQTFMPASSTEVLYPDAPMTPLSYNLDKMNTKYISNFSFPGAGPFTGKTLDLAGWSTDRDGGFSYGTSFMGVYTGMGAVPLPDAIDVQVGCMVSGPDNYIVVAYYDLAASMYSYNLYRWDLMLGTISFEYKYKFMRPEALLPMFVPHVDYLPAYPGSSSGYPAPSMAAMTMQYNRISMDIGKYGDKVVFVMTDESDGKMFTSVGEIIADTLILCPYLPQMPIYAVVAPIGITPTTPIHVITTAFPYTGWTAAGGGAYDYLDGASGIYARYYTTGPLAGKYHYSYYPIDEWTYITEYDGVNCTQLPSKTNFSPLIGLKATSMVTSPYLNPHYEQYWPDVSMGNKYVPRWTFNMIDFVFYVHNTGMQDLYVGSYDWLDLFNQTGSGLYGPWPSYSFTGPTDVILACQNTADGKNLSSDWITGPGHGLYSIESSSVSLPSSDPVRAEIDSKDGGMEDWAITFAYKPSASIFSTTTGYADPVAPAFIIHKPTDVGFNNIYVRYPYKKQIIVNNGSMGHVSGGPAYSRVNVEKNINPSLCWDATGAYLSVAWASEKAGLMNMTPWAYVACKIDPYTPFGSKSSASYTSMPDYLHVANTPSQDCGFTPLISLSKHDYGLSDIYTSFTQEDGSGTYSVVHKNNPWSSISTWRKTEEKAALDNSGLQVGPNPFTSTLRVGTNGFTQAIMYDIMGKQIFSCFGAENELNAQINSRIGSLVPGTYNLMLKQTGLNKQFFKLVKL